VNNHQKRYNGMTSKIVTGALMAFIVLVLLFLSGCRSQLSPLGEHEAIRVYTEFADGGNRGMYDPDTGGKGLPDQEYDATTAMVVNWHRLPEANPEQNARLHFRQIHPLVTSWESHQGESYEFWHREERVNRVILTRLDPGAVYEVRLKEDGEVFRFRTLPSSLEERPVRIVMTADHQAPDWRWPAHENARMAALQKPDIFLVAGDFVNDEGEVTERNAERWVTYLDNLYGVGSGHFHYEDEIDGRVVKNLIIPHVSVLGNHETGKRNHLRWPADLLSGSGPSYPEYVSANWMELLFHWPYSSEGFYSEFNSNHPNMAEDSLQEGFGQGGFGKLSFSNYLMLIALDSSQNWEAAPDRGLRDWQGNLITDKWPWYEKHHADVRQDLWLANLLEPEGRPAAGEIYTHIIPVWHRGLFGTVRQNMSLKNRGHLKYWLPILHRNGVKLIKEAHDHSYTRTVPMEILDRQPEGTRLEKVHYEPNTWELTDNLPETYIDDFFAVNSLIDEQTGEIVGWEYEGNYIHHALDGMIVTGHGGWAAGRRELGHWGGGNAGLWYVDTSLGGDAITGEDSFHITIVDLEPGTMTVESVHPRELESLQAGRGYLPIYRYRWDLVKRQWLAFNQVQHQWVPYEDGMQQLQ